MFPIGKGTRVGKMPGMTTSVLQKILVSRITQYFFSQIDCAYKLDMEPSEIVSIFIIIVE